MYLRIHDTNHHVIPKSMKLQTVLFRPNYMHVHVGLISAVQHTHLWYYGFIYLMYMHGDDSKPVHKVHYEM